MPTFGVDRATAADVLVAMSTAMPGGGAGRPVAAPIAVGEETVATEKLRGAMLLLSPPPTTDTTGRDGPGAGRVAVAAGELPPRIFSMARSCAGVRVLMRLCLFALRAARSMTIRSGDFFLPLVLDDPLPTGDAEPYASWAVSTGALFHDFPRTNAAISTDVDFLPLGELPTATEDSTPPSLAFIVRTPGGSAIPGGSVGERALPSLPPLPGDGGVVTLMPRTSRACRRRVATQVRCLAMGSSAILLRRRSMTWEKCGEGEEGDEGGVATVWEGVEGVRLLV